MYKSLEYSSLHSLMEEYKTAYCNCGHTLLKVSQKRESPISNELLEPGTNRRAGDP